jgi:CubicO group peptidase (beta-lactamase class C family)
MEQGLRIGRRALLGGVAAAAGLGADPSFARAAQAARAPGWKAVQALIDGYVARGAVPGVVVGILEAGRFRPTWLRAGTIDFGNGVPVDERTLWRIYSMTKPVTGVTVMQLLGEGRLTLDTPLADICPEFAAMRVLVDPEKGLESRPAERPIRVRHLLTHSAGFSYTINGDGPLEREYRRLGIQPMSSATLVQPGDTPAPELRTYLERLATIPLAYEPGSRFLYSVALDVAGGMIERLTGQTLDRVFESRLFGPLGMRDTGFWLDAGRLPRLAAIHGWVNPATVSYTHLRAPRKARPARPSRERLGGAPGHARGRRRARILGVGLCPVRADAAERGDFRGSSPAAGRGGATRAAQPDGARHLLSRRRRLWRGRFRGACRPAG